VAVYQNDDGRWVYFWDADNRLVMMTDKFYSLPNSARKQLGFNYDYMGRRVLKVVSTWNGTAYASPVTTRFVYDGWNLLAELDAGNDNAVVCSYMWGSDLSGSLRDSGGVGGLLTVSPNGTGTYFVAYDGNGNVVSLTDGSGSICARYEYSPFGETIRANGSAVTQNAIRFSTKYADFESGMLYYGYRFYNPSFGRWLGRDPLEERGGVGLYILVQNDPINAADLLGLMAKVEIGDIFRRRKAATQAANLACKCLCPERENRHSISGRPTGKRTVYATTSWVDNPDGCGPYNTAYYWWNCYSGTHEGGASSRADYGWSSGGAGYSINVEPPWYSLGLHYFSDLDPCNIAVASIVIYEQCVHGKVETRITEGSNGLVFTWDSFKGRWIGPSDVTR